MVDSLQVRIHGTGTL